jgi:hypothetical protein
MPAGYVHGVARAGGRPMLVPPLTEGVEETLDALDAGSSSRAAPTSI